MYCTAAVTAFKSTCYTLVCMKELRMSNNAQLMSTAPSVFVRDTCPPSVFGKSSGQKQNTTAFVR